MFSLHLHHHSRPFRVKKSSPSLPPPPPSVMLRICLPGSPPPLGLFHRVSPPPASAIRFRVSAAHPESSASASASAAAAATAAAMPRPHPHPSLEVVGGSRHDLFLPVLEALERPYSPFPLIGWSRHLETIFAAFFRSLPDVRLRRRCLRTQDGGSVALDWVSGDDRRLPLDSPVLILLVRELVLHQWQHQFLLPFTDYLLLPDLIHPESSLFWKYKGPWDSLM